MEVNFIGYPNFKSNSKPWKAENSSFDFWQVTYSDFLFMFCFGMIIFLCTMFVNLEKAMWTRLMDFTPPLFQIFRPSYGPEGGSCCHALHTSRRAWERSHHVKRPSELCLRKSNLCVKVVGLHRYLPCCLFEPGLTIIDVRCFCKEHLWNLLKEFRYACLETLDKVKIHLFAHKLSST